MKKEKKTEIKVGITVLSALILLAFVYGWSKNYSLNSDDLLLKIKFPTTAGLEVGDMTSVNGVRKGIVKSIEAIDNYALVEVIFNESVKLKEDATFSVMMHDLMGGKKIEINSGISKNNIDFTIVQNGIFAGDVSTAMATLNSVESDLVEVIGELKFSLSTVNSLLDNPEFLNNISSIMQKANQFTDNLNIVLKENRFAINQTIKNTNEITQQANNILTSNSSSISSIILALDSTLISSYKLFDKLNKLSIETENKENNLGKLLYNDEIINDLSLSLKQIKQLTNTLNEQLKSGGLEVKADVDLF